MQCNLSDLTSFAFTTSSLPLYPNSSKDTSMASTGRPLAAAPSTQSTVPFREGDWPNQDPSGDPNPSKRPKRTLIESACSACRKRKSKCDGARPVCSRCQALGTQCVYEAEEGESRWSALRRRSRDMKIDRDELREILTFLQSQPEADALEIFHRIRSSSAHETLPGILQDIRDRQSATSSGPTGTPSAHSNETRLPPIRSIIGLPEVATSPTRSSQARRASLASDGSGSYGSSHSGYDPQTSQSPGA